MTKTVYLVTKSGVGIKADIDETTLPLLQATLATGDYVTEVEL